MSEEEEEDWFGGFLAFEFDDAETDDTNISATTYQFAANEDLPTIMTRIGTTIEYDDPCQDYAERTKLVEMKMGSMAQCRGCQGEVLREAGAIAAILSTLQELVNKLPSPTDTGREEGVLKLALACFGAARDLGCGSAGNREALREVESDGVGGMKLMALYLRRYDGIRWDEVDSLQLKLLSAVIGTMRNVTHSTPENIEQLHQNGVSEMLIWRLKYASGCDDATTLPDSSEPCREGAFRSAATLINMAEKSRECAELYARDQNLVRLLVESWGGNNKKLPVLHLGLAAILRSAKAQSEIFVDRWEEILVNEEQRKLVAQRCEEERKRVASK